MKHAMHNVWKYSLATTLGLALGSAAPDAALAQDSSLMRRSQDGQRRPLTLQNESMLFQRIEPPKTLQLNDIVTVVVNINSRMFSSGNVQNRKQINLDIILRDWVGLDGLAFRPDPQSLGDPRFRGAVNSQFRTEADLKTRNGLTFTIAAKVIDVLPNGTMVIEARQQFNINEEQWERWLTGVIRREDVSPDNKIESEDIAELNVHNREIGMVRDGYRRGWLQRFYDRFQPF